MITRKCELITLVSERKMHHRDFVYVLIKSTRLIISNEISSLIKFLIFIILFSAARLCVAIPVESSNGSLSLDSHLSEPAKLISIAGKDLIRPVVGDVAICDIHKLPGVKIVSANENSVMAVADGTVIYSGSDMSQFGNLVVIRHSGNYYSFYGYNKHNLVEQGSKVTRGQVIATMGSDSDGNGNVLFILKHGDDYLNAKSLFPSSTIYC